MPNGVGREGRDESEASEPRSRDSAGEASVFDGETRIASLVDRLLAAIESPDYRPPLLPSIAIDLTALAARADASPEETVALVDRDEWFKDCLRTTAAEEAKGTRIKLGSTRQVCLYFGLLRLRDFAVEQAVERWVIRTDELAAPDGHGGAMPDLLRHARASAHLARAIAESTAKVDESAYIAGLLHDVGIAGVLRVLSERAADFGFGVRPSPKTTSTIIWPAIERIHARVGSLMAHHWGFPLEIELAIGSHHVLPCADDASPMGAAVAIANELADREGFALARESDDERATDRTPPHIVDRHLALLGLERSNLHLIAHRAKQALREIDGKPDPADAG